MSNVEPIRKEAHAFKVNSKAQADMLFEMCSGCQATGPNARTLADLFDEAKRAKAAFADEK